MFCGLVVYAIKRKKNLGLAGRNVPNPLTKPEIKKFVFITLVVIVLFLLYLFLLHLNNALYNALFKCSKNKYSKNNTITTSVINTNFLISGLVNGFGTLRPAKPKFFLRLIA